MPKVKKITETKEKSSAAKAMEDVKLEITEEIKDLETPVEEVKEEVKAKETKSVRVERNRGKKYQSAKKMIDSTKTYTIEEAVKLAKESSTSKFGGSIEAHFNVSKKGVSGEAKLPHFEAKTQKVVIFNDEVLSDIKDGKLDFDVLLATPADMAKLVPFAKVLGPKGLMPNPKNGTIVPNPKEAAEKFSQAAFTFKTEADFPLIHTIIGKFDQKDEELIANYKALVAAIDPKNIQKAVIKSTMGPSVKVQVA